MIHSSVSWFSFRKCFEMVSSVKLVFLLSGMFYATHTNMYAAHKLFKLASVRFKSLLCDAWDFVRRISHLKKKKIFGCFRLKVLGVTMRTHNSVLKVHFVTHTKSD